MLGLGLHPDLCGNGIGRELISLVLATFKIQYGDAILRLEVRTYNKRAIKCYESAGFIKVDEYYRNTPAGTGEFILMEYNV